MIERRAFKGFGAAFVIVAVIACMFGHAWAQKREPMPRVGILTPAPTATAKPLWDAFRERMKELGYIDGKNVVYAYRSAEGQLDRLPQLVAELVNMPVKVMVVANTSGNLAAKKATKTIPIVMVGVGDPFRVGLVSNLGKPGGNITGFTNLSGELAAKRFQILKELVPTATRIGAIGNPGDPNVLIQIQDDESAARTLKVHFRLFTVKDAAQLETAFEEARTWRAQALMRLADPLQASLRERTIELAAKNRIPVMYSSGADVAAGGLIGYGVDILDTYKRAAAYVDRILKGAHPGELPIQQPMKLELAVNLKAAEALSIKIPQAILSRADLVIE